MQAVEMKEGGWSEESCMQDMAVWCACEPDCDTLMAGEEMFEWCSHNLGQAHCANAHLGAALDEKNLSCCKLGIG